MIHSAQLNIHGNIIIICFFKKQLLVFIHDSKFIFVLLLAFCVVWLHNNNFMILILLISSIYSPIFLIWLTLMEVNLHNYCHHLSALLFWFTCILVCVCIYFLLKIHLQVSATTFVCAYVSLHALPELII